LSYHKFVNSVVIHKEKDKSVLFTLNLFSDFPVFLTENLAQKYNFELFYENDFVIFYKKTVGREIHDGF
jgi:hypothetical protein